MNKCLICQTPVRFIKFKCQDGYVCKKCYEAASLNFSQTIKNKTKEDLLKIIQLSEEAVPAFEISRRINQLILFDDQHGQLCLPNHQKYCYEQRKPEIFAFNQIVNCKVVEQQVERMIKKKKEQLGSIKVLLEFQQGETREILLVPNPIRRDSMPYKTMSSLAKTIVQEVKNSKVEAKVC